MDVCLRKILQTLIEQTKNQLWFFISLTVALVCGGTAVYYAYLSEITFFIMTLSILWPWLCVCMVTLNATNPGIFPSRKEYYEGNKHNKFKMTDVNLFGSDITAKFKSTYLPRTFCTTCKFNRPLRVHHCRTCDKCIERFDHHCSWIGNCVGSFNRKIFFVFLCVTTITDYLATIITGYSIYFNVVNKRSMATPLLFVSFIIFSCVMYYITKLLAFHTKAVCNNYTTSEYIKNKDLGLPNPYDEGIQMNITKFFFTPDTSCGGLFSKE